MTATITWVSDDKTSKKGKPFRSFIVENDNFKCWSFVMLPSDLKKGDIVTGKLDLLGNRPQFLIDRS